MRKLTKEDVQTIRGLYKTKEYTQTQLGEMFGVKYSTISYWVNDEYRKRHKKDALKTHIKNYKEKTSWRFKYPEKYKEYQNNYYKKRYHTDEEFRRKHIDRCIRYQKKKRLNK